MTVRTLLLSLAAVLVITPAAAQESAPNLRMTVPIGNVFEIVAVQTTEDETVDWVLTRDKTFVEAGRNTIFRTRFTEEGTYQLDGTVRGSSGNRRLTLTLRVTADAAEEETVDAIVRTDPPLSDGTVVLPEDAPVITLIPSEKSAGTIRADVDTGTDSDGDGTPGNDDDLLDTLFATEQNPLRLWYTRGAEEVSMRVMLIAEDGSATEQNLTVANTSRPVVSIGDVSAREEGDGLVRFAFDPGGVEPHTVVYQWEFGDGYGSLIDSPVHRYLRNGEYDVRVTVRQMNSGNVVAQGEGRLIVTSAPGSTSSASAVSSAAAEPEPAPAPSGGTSMGTIVRILLIVLTIAGLGAFAYWGWKKFLHRESRLQKKFEEAEARLSGKLPGTSEVAPPTFELKRPEAPLTPAATEPSPAPEPEPQPQPETRPQPEPEPTPEPPPAPEPQIVMDTAPDWLKQGLGVEPETPSLPGAPTISEPPPPLPAEPTPTQDALPPWLQEAPHPAFTQEPPQQPPAPTPESTPLPPPPAPVVEPEPAPALLEPAPVVPAIEPAPTTPALPVQGAQETGKKSSVADAAAQERIERERERKRRKRQRYRENLKKRKSDQTASAPPATPPSNPPTDKEILASDRAPKNTPESIADNSPKPADMKSPNVSEKIPEAPPPPLPQEEDPVKFIIKAEDIKKDEGVQ